MEQQILYSNQTDETDNEIMINYKKIFYTLWNRRNLILKVFFSVLIFFVLITFISPKKYKVDADLYINKANNSNMTEINPFFIEENSISASILSSGLNSIIVNELELMQSPLVIDNVIRENNLVYKKLFGIIPNRKEGEFISTKAFLKKNISFKNKKGTNVVTIEYKNKDPELAYNVLNSIIKNYIILHKEINAEKSKSDKKVIEKEYTKSKEELEKKATSVVGLPEQAAAGAGTLSAMSAFSKSAQKALSVVHSQVVEGARSKMEVSEEAAKVANLSSKLQWATMVEEMSDISKVLVLKEPQKLRDFEYSSPKLIINILLGIILGAIAALFGVIIKENTDNELTYTMLGDKIIYDLQKDFDILKLELLTKQNKNITIVVFENISSDIYIKLQEFKNVKFIKGDISNTFVSNIEETDEVMTIAKIGVTSSKLYSQVKVILVQMKKPLINEILV